MMQCPYVLCKRSKPVIEVETISSLACSFVIDKNTHSSVCFCQSCERFFYIDHVYRTPDSRAMEEHKESLRQIYLSYILHLIRQGPIRIKTYFHRGVSDGMGNKVKQGP